MVPKSPASEKDLARLLKPGEGPNLEIKRSTGELREGLQTVCAFLNGSGGIVLFGVRPDGRPEGQQVSGQTFRDMAQALERFEPPVDLPIERLPLANEREILILRVTGTSDSVPFTFDGRPYERVASATRRMSQEKYEKLLLARAHTMRRWENQPTDEIALKDIDREEVFRIVDIARSVGRLVGPVGRSLPDVLTRLGLRKDGHILQAAVVLFGKTFVPDYPQCELRLARFRGTNKTEFLDQRQVRGPAFKLLEEAEIFCQRHFPMPARIVPGQMRRVETLLIPPDAMREILVNALIHRDYSIAGGAVSLAIFDDRVEVWSAGSFPKGITPESLTRNHQSVQRNPLIADVFHRTGLIEKWGRGTNRVVDMCREAGIARPEFEEITGAAVVTFRVRVGETAGTEVGSKVESGVGSQPGSRPESSTSPVPVQYQSLEGRILASLRRGALPISIISKQLGQERVSGQLKVVLKVLLTNALIEFTVPDKPNSRMQKYRLTEKGQKALHEQAKLANGDAAPDASRRG
jgi:ATP-dependent DNA helicase RecG